MRIIAHRGCMAQFPENTLAAVRGSAPHVDAVELDVRRCGSGELVVCHDETLDRVTGASGRVGETPLARLRELDVLGSGEGIPLLDDAFGAVPDDVGVNVELKERGTADDAREVAADHPNDVLVSSFDPGALREARDAGFDDLGLLFRDGADDAIETAASIGCAYLHPALDLCTGGEFVDRAHRRGFEVNAWTARTEDDLAVLAGAGVDGAICDRYDLA